MIRRYLQLILRVIRERPFYLWKYSRETLRYYVNAKYLTYRHFLYPNINICSNPRLLSRNVFKAEKPDASIQVGANIVIHDNCDILATGKGQIVIGNNCSFGSNFRMYCKERIILGDCVLISWNVLIMDYDAHALNPDIRYEEREHMHKRFSSFSTLIDSRKITNQYKAAFNSRPIVIGNNVWIGTQAMIFKGVKIGSGSVIAAGTIVTSDIPENSLVAGNPGRIIRSL